MKYKRKLLCDLGTGKCRSSGDEAIELARDISLKKNFSVQSKEIKLYC